VRREGLAKRHKQQHNEKQKNWVIFMANLIFVMPVLVALGVFVKELKK
jgi:hypothetical protein